MVHSPSALEGCWRIREQFSTTSKRWEQLNKTKPNNKKTNKINKNKTNIKPLHTVEKGEDVLSNRYVSILLTRQKKINRIIANKHY